MKTQRGFAAWIYLAGAIAILGLLSGMAYLAKDYLDGIDRKAYERGRQEVLAKTAMRDNEKLYVANQRAHELQLEKDAIEAARDADMEQLDADYLKRFRNAQATHDRTAADLRAQLVVLRDPGRARASPNCTGDGRDPAAAALAGAGVGDGGGGGELSGQAAEFLLGEALRADQVVVKLTACQTIVRDDRKANAP